MALLNDEERKNSSVLDFLFEVPSRAWQTGPKAMSFEEVKTGAGESRKLQRKGDEQKSVPEQKTFPRDRAGVSSILYLY